MGGGVVMCEVSGIGVVLERRRLGLFVGFLCFVGGDVVV